MKKKTNLNEGLMDAIVGGIMTWAIKKDINKDPEFQKTLATYNSDIARLASEIEELENQLSGKKKKK